MPIERGKSLRVRVTSEEKDLLDEVAASQGFPTMSGWVRWVLYEAALALAFVGEMGIEGDEWRGLDGLAEKAAGLDLNLLSDALQKAEWVLLLSRYDDQVSEELYDAFKPGEFAERLRDRVLAGGDVDESAARALSWVKRLSEVE